MSQCLGHDHERDISSSFKKQNNAHSTLQKGHNYSHQLSTEQGNKYMNVIKPGDITQEEGTLGEELN